MNARETIHIPVLLDAIIRHAKTGLAESKAVRVLDCTLGGAGHAREILSQLPEVMLIALDRDSSALKRATVSLEQYMNRVTLRQSNFADLETVLDVSEKFGFVLADLGISSDQLDDAERGFSFRNDGPLDMRVDQSSGATAQQLVNDTSPSELTRLLRIGGVRKGFRQYADAIVAARPLNTTAELLAAITPVGERLRYQRDAQSSRKQAHPATVIFQALRIAVNNEDASLRTFLKVVPKYIAPHGILAVISFHSGEDRIVTHEMRAWERAPLVPSHIPLKEQPRGLGKLLTKQAIVADEVEIQKNPRSRSARLRVFQMGALAA